MATVDKCVKDHFTFLWIIENVSELTYINLRSPPFVEHSISEKAMCLQLDENEGFRLHIRSEDDFLLEESCKTIVEVSILAADGSTLISSRNNESELFVNLLTRNDFLERKTEFIVDNAITVQCKMLKIKDKILTGFCCVRTELEMYRKSILWAVEEFSVLRSSTNENLSELTTAEKKVYSLKPFSRGESTDKMCFVLYLKQNSHSEDVHVDFVVEEIRDYAYVYEITALDASGKVIISKIERGRISEVSNFSPLISKSQLTNKKNLFLPNDTLLLKCSFEIYLASNSGKVEYSTPNISLDVTSEKMIYIINPILLFDVIRATGRNPIQNIDKVNEEEEEDDDDEEDGCNGDSCSLKTALGYLLNDATLSDMNLKIGDKLYPVHKNILWSRSPVFEEILSTNVTKEIIEIKDMDENTLEHLLPYIYSETVGTIDFETALKLYSIAHDNQFWDLRYECSYVLRRNLRVSNFHLVMEVAQKCQDDNLEWAAEQYEYAISLGADEDMDCFENDIDD